MVEIIGLAMTGALVWLPVSVMAERAMRHGDGSSRFTGPPSPSKPT
jgi:hypothetical protein